MRNLIDIVETKKVILETTDTESVELLSEEAMSQILEGHSRGGKVGMFKILAAALGGAVVVTILQQMGILDGSVDPMDYLGPDGQYIEPVRSDFGPSTRDAGPDGRYIEPTRHEF